MGDVNLFMFGTKSEDTSGNINLQFDTNQPTTKSHIEGRPIFEGRWER